MGLHQKYDGSPCTLTTRLLPLKTCVNYIFGMPGALTAPLATLNY